MPTYITFPINSEPEDLIADVVAEIQARFPGWQPNDGALDTAMIEAFAAIAADVRALASQATDAIFARFGSSLMEIPPIEATPAHTTATFYAIDSAGHTVTAGTRVAIADSAGTLWPFYVQSDVVIASGASATGVGEVVLVAVIPGTDSSGIGADLTATLVDVRDWVDHVTLVGITTGGVDAEAFDTYLNRLRTELQLLTPRPILPRDFAILARKVTGVYRAVAIDGFQPNNNELTLNDASLETSVGNWVNSANATVTRDSGEAEGDGSASLKLVSLAAGDMGAKLANAGMVAVTPGEQITVLATVKPASARTCHAVLRWYDSSHVLISSEYSSAAVGAGVTHAFSHTGIAPATSAWASVGVDIIGTAAGSEVAHADKLAVVRGSSTTWVAGGSPGYNNERTVAIAAMDSTGTDVDAGTKTAITAYLEALREVNFLVPVVALNVNSFDVHYTLQSTSGYDITDVGDRVDDAIVSFFDPASWGVPQFGDPLGWDNTTVARYLELAQAINNVEGVDYISSLTFCLHGGTPASVDVTLAGPAPVGYCDPANITGTVT